jgi:Flp pilus assembly protein TadD
MGLGMSRLSSGETDRGLADLQSAVELDSNKYRADLVLITSYLQRGKYDEALKAMESLEKKQPSNPLTYNLKAGIYLGKKDQASARKNLEHALELNPLYIAAATNLAQLDIQDNKPRPHGAASRSCSKRAKTIRTP